MPELPRLFLVNGALGFVISAIFVALLLAANVGGLSDLVGRSGMGLFALGLIWVMNGLLFGAVQISVRVMTEDPEGAGR